MAIKGWGERELPEGYEWNDWSGADKKPSLWSGDGRLTEADVEFALRVFAPDQIETQCHVTNCELTESHAGWPCLTKEGRGYPTLAGQGEPYLGYVMGNYARNAAPWFAGADDAS